MEAERRNNVMYSGGPSAHGSSKTVDVPSAVNMSNAALNQGSSQIADLGVIAQLLQSPHSKDQGLDTLQVAI